MLFGDNEIDIINYLQNLDNSEICFPVESSEAIEILDTIHSKEKWANWRDSSGNSDPPPDFYSDEYRLMIDVMRVNDTERKNKKGKLLNPTIKHERELYREIQDSGILDRFPNVNVHTIGDTGLSSFEDHNYKFYRKNFARVINKHIASIPIYQRNHPNYKTIFVVYDESTGYILLENEVSPDTQFHKGQLILGKPHLFFADKVFLECFYNKGIDYLLWLAPYKLIDTPDKPLILPRLTVFDLSKDAIKSIEYDETKMVSSEI